jgi:hypothetical protein
MRFAVSLACFEKAIDPAPNDPALRRDRKDEVDGGRLEVSRHSHLHLLASFSRGLIPFEIVKYRSAHTRQSI